MTKPRKEFVIEGTKYEPEKPNEYPRVYITLDLRCRICLQDEVRWVIEERFFDDSWYFFGSYSSLESALHAAAYHMLVTYDSLVAIASEQGHG